MILMHLIQHATDMASMLQHVPARPGQPIIPQQDLVATPVPVATPSGAGQNPYYQIESFVLNITNFLQILSFSIFLLSVTVAGIMYMLSMNNDRHKAAATGAIVTAVVGLIITLLAVGMHGLIVSAFPQ